VDVPRDWWKGFFSGIAIELWRAVTPGEQTRAEAAFCEQQLHLAPGARVLDVACGDGRLALELASRGYGMTGVDYSAAFLEEARATSSARQLEIGWQQRDMRDLPWPAVFDGAICFGNSFGYQEDDDNREFLRAVAQVLKPGARLVLETTCTELALRSFQEKSWFEAGGILMLERNEYDLMRSRMNTEYTFIADGKTERKRGSQRYYGFAELCGLLEAAGFGNLQAFGSLDLAPLAMESQRMFMTATKTTAAERSPKATGQS
jgi:SAM-dependent methyltransferase